MGEQEATMDDMVTEEEGSGSDEELKKKSMCGFSEMRRGGR